MNEDIFRTKVEFKGRTLVDPKKTVICMGSCFAEVLGNRLDEARFAISVNPFGTLFHPFSLFSLLHPRAELDESLFCESKDAVQHFRLPKTFYAANREGFRKDWEDRKTSLQEDLQGDSVLLLTLGTSYLYERQGAWVANCLKRPASEFQKVLTPLEVMKGVWDELFPTLPVDLRIIVTVSPVRHLKDGLSENSLSKCLLRALAEIMVGSDPSRITYFPAYEILLDELRDYRFYERDMLHPSPVAVDYIAKRFQDAYFSEDAKSRMREWEKLKARKDHRSLHPDSEETRKFQEELERDLKAWSEISPQRSSRRRRS